jgi:DNA polymerase lambda
MPRSEAENLSAYVKSVALKLFPDKDIRVETCGSFRRGRAMCGDVDILITSVPKSKTGGTWLEELDEINGILPKLTTALTKGPDGNFLVQRLGADRIAQTGSQTYMGICQLGKGFKRRRIDIKVYPRSQYGFAILYFTGSAQFNKNMRLKALQHGFSLSDAGLYKLGHKGGYGEGATSSQQTDEYAKLEKSLG